MPAEIDRKLIELILERRMATRQQITECLMERPVDGTGDIADELVERGVITPVQAEHVRGSATDEMAVALPEIEGYEILEKIGSGAMGVVYKGRQLSMNRPVAIKVLPASLTQDTKFVERFISEARTAGRLNHPNIVQGIDVGKTAVGSYYFIMELIEGETVQDILECNGRIPEEKALRIVRDIALALSHASSNGLIHRDVKPENIIVSKAGTAKLADLGLAAPVDQVGRDTRQVVGTPYYIAPEIVRGDRDIDVRADIYSLGATFFHMVTGTLPFNGSSASVVMTKHLSETFPLPQQRESSVTPATSRMIAKMTARNKSERYPSPTELVTDIDQIISGEIPGAVVRTHKPSRAGTAKRVPAKRRTSGAPVAAVVGVIIIGSLLAALVGYIAITQSPRENGGMTIVEEPDPVKPGPGETTAALAAKALAAARKHREDHPGDIVGAQTAFRAVLRYKGTPAATDAQAELNRLSRLRRKRRAKAAGQAFAGVKKEAETLLSAGKFAEATEAYKNFIRRFPGTSTAGEAEGAIQAVIAKAKQKFEAEHLRAQALMKQQKPQDAISVYRSVMEWGLEEVTELALAEVNKIERIVREQRAAQAARRERAVKQARARFDAALKLRKYADAAAAMKAALKEFPDHEQAACAALVNDMHRLAALHGRIVQRIGQKLGQINFSAKGAVGKITKVTADRLEVDAGRVKIGVKWAEIASRLYCRLVRDLTEKQNGPELLDLALLHAWEGDPRSAELCLREAKAAGADVTHTAARLMAIERRTENEEGNRRLAAIRNAIKQGKYADAVREIDNLEKVMAKTQFLKKNSALVRSFRAKCAAHHVTCPVCFGRGRIKCKMCGGDGKIVQMKKCPACDGTGKRSVVSVTGLKSLVTCRECRGRGRVRLVVKCPKCGGTGRVVCPRCKGSGKIYR